MPGAISPWEIKVPGDAITPARPALANDPAVRAVTVIGLIAVGIIHSLEVPGQVSGAVWLTIGFCLLAVVAPGAGLWLLLRPSLLAWEFTGVVCALAAAGYVLTRSVPVPGDAGDVGNWLRTIGRGRPDHRGSRRDHRRAHPGRYLPDQLRQPAVGARLLNELTGPLSPGPGLFAALAPAGRRPRSRRLGTAVALRASRLAVRG